MLPELRASSGVPVYRQLAETLRAEITSGRLAPGDRLPSEAELMERYGLARATIRQALQILRSEGLIVAEHGRGVFVRSRTKVHRLASDRFARRHRAEGNAAFIAEVEAAGHTPSVDSLQIRTELPTAEVTRLLRLKKNQRTLVRQRRYLIDGEPAEVATSYLPLAIARNTPISEPNPGPGGIYARLEDLGYILEHFTEDVSSRMPTPEEATALRLVPGVPVLTLVRVAYARDDVPVEVCDTVLSPDAYVLHYTLPAR